jgi:hypothetical protein
VKEEEEEEEAKEKEKEKEEEEEDEEGYSKQNQRGSKIVWIVFPCGCLPSHACDCVPGD